MNGPAGPHNLEELLELLGKIAAEEDRISLAEILNAVGRRSFGPVLLLAGLITLAPIVGDIPGMSTLMGIIVLLTAGQLLLGREYFWLPRRLRERSIACDRLCRAIRKIAPAARFVDRFLRSRWGVLVGKAGTLLIAGVSTVVALAMPVMEFIPFSANGAGLILTAFGLALIANDGVWALLALVFTAGAFSFIVYSLV